MLKKFQLVIIILTLISCQSKQEKLIGHWHEYKTNNSDYLNCYHITDSTFGTNPRTYGGYSNYERGDDLNRLEIVSLANGDYNQTSDFTIRGKRLILNDSIYWVKQTDDEETFLSDFSAGLPVSINPFESNSSEFDYKSNDKLSIYIYVGKLKKSALNRYKKFNSEKYHILLNDKIGRVEDLRSFVICGHCDTRKIGVFINADKNTPTEFLTEIESEILNYLNKKQIYYLTINLKELRSGYNHSY